MDVATLRGIRTELDEFLTKFDGCFQDRRSVSHLGVYVRGQLGPLQRKSVEPIALDADVHPRTLQQFLSCYKWDEAEMCRRARQIIVERYGHSEAIGILDETSFAKKGKKTAGIQRQYCGSTGKVDNCVVTVHLDYAVPGFHTLVDGDLYVPEGWLADAARCKEAGMPADVTFRTKWQIGLDLIDRSARDGIFLRWITADEGYGEVPAFLDGVAARGLHYVVEVPRSVRGWTPNGLRIGRKMERVEALWWRGGPTWLTYSIKETTKGDVVWRVRTSVFVPSWDRTQRLRLIVAENLDTGELKYFLSNAPIETPLSSLLTVAFSRWQVERIFEDAKQEIGFRHFEVRGYKAVQRHLAISLVSLLFLSSVVTTLGGEKGRDVVALAGAHRDRRSA